MLLLEKCVVDFSKVIIFRRQIESIKYSLDRTYCFAVCAVDAIRTVYIVLFSFVGGVNAVDGADVYTTCILYSYTRLSYYKYHYNKSR